MLTSKKYNLNIISALMISLISVNNLSSKAEELKGFDAHVHVSQIRMGDMTFDPERAFFALWSAGLSKAGIISGAYDSSGNPNCKNGNNLQCIPDREWTEKENNFIAETVKKNPDKFFGFAGIDLNASWSDDEIRRCSAIGLKAIKIHTLATNMNLTVRSNYKKVNEAVRLAGELNLKVLLHANFYDTEETSKLIEIINDNPKTQIIIGHMLGNEYKRLSEINNPNAYVEISATIVNQYFAKNIDDVALSLRKFGINKVLFASDWPIIHPIETIKVLKQYPFTKEEMEQIMWQNSEKLFSF